MYCFPWRWLGPLALLNTAESSPCWDVDHAGFCLNNDCSAPPGRQTAPNIWQCQKLCYDTQGCQFFAYHHGGNTCWLKTQKGSFVGGRAVEVGPRRCPAGRTLWAGACSDIADPATCCLYKDGGNSDQYIGQDCVPAATGMTFTSTNTCEPHCWIHGTCGGGGQVNRMGSCTTVFQILSGQICVNYAWLQYWPTGPEGCISQVNSDARCTNVIIWAAGSSKRCGCSTLLDCFTNYHAEPNCNIYQQWTTTTSSAMTTTTAYSCCSGGGPACFTCVPQTQRTSNCHCATCNIGYSNPTTSGCQAACTVPSKVGYNVALATGTTTISGFSPSGVACASGYVGTVTYTVCTSGGSPYSVSGCQPTTLTTTTTYYEVLEGALTLTVANVSQFINDPNVRAPLKKAIANMSEVNETWVRIDNITSLLTRRLSSFGFGELRVRMLSVPHLSSTLSNGVKVNFHVDVRHDGSTLVTAEIVMSRITAVAFAEISKLVNTYLDAGLIGGNKYNVQVQYAVVKVKTKSTGTVPPVSLSPSPSSSNGLVIFVCIMAISSVILLASILRIYCMWARYRRPQKIESRSRDFSILCGKTAAELLHPPVIITDEDRFVCFDFLRTVLDSRKGIHSEVYITFAVGKRDHDVQLSGPGLYHATAITKALHDRGVVCNMSLPGFNDIALEAAYQQSISCKLLLVLETRALYMCMKSLQEIESALANNVEVMRVRIEAGLPDESMQWPNVCTDGDMFLLRNLYNLISPWSKELLPDDDRYIDHCADHVKLQLGLLETSKLDFKITRETMVSGKTIGRPRSDAVRLHQEPGQAPLIDRSASSVSGLPGDDHAAHTDLKLEQTKSMPAKLKLTATGPETKKSSKSDLLSSDPQIQISSAVPAPSSKHLKPGSRKKLQPESIERTARHRSGSKKNRAARPASVERRVHKHDHADLEKVASVRSERGKLAPSSACAGQRYELDHDWVATDITVRTQCEKDASAVTIQKRHRGNVGLQAAAKNDQELNMPVDKDYAKASKFNHSRKTAATSATEETEWRTARAAPTTRAKARPQEPDSVERSKRRGVAGTKSFAKRNQPFTSPARRPKGSKAAAE